MIDRLAGGATTGVSAGPTGIPMVNPFTGLPFNTQPNTGSRGGSQPQQPATQSQPAAPAYNPLLGGNPLLAQLMQARMRKI